jgi:hypothetical protein
MTNPGLATMNGHPFKDAARHTYKMLRLKLFFIYRDGRKDDTISIHSTRSGNLFRVVMRPSEYENTQFETFMTLGKVLDYIHNSLKSLQYDVDPYEQVQITSMMSPTILYHVADMSSEEVRHLIDDILYDELTCHVTQENQQ